MASTSNNRGNSDYVVAASSAQDAQPSPLAMLAATCSKIGSPAQTEEGYGQGGDSTVRVVGAGQGGTTGSTSDAIASGWMQLSNGTIVDSTGKPVNTGNVLQASALSSNVGGQLFAQGQQLVATPGPNGQLTYSVVPSFQTVNIEGQEAFIIPSSGVNQQQTMTAAAAQNAAMSQAQAQQTLITPAGQIIRAPGVANSSTTTNLLQNVTGLGGLGNFVNIGGNIVSLGAMQNVMRPANNILQAVQFPGTGFQTLQQVPNLIQVPVSVNGQTVLQTVQLPAQNIPIQTPIQQVNGSGIVTIGSNQQPLQTVVVSQAQAASQQAATTGMSVTSVDESQNINQNQSRSMEGAKHEMKPTIAQLSSQVTSQSSASQSKVSNLAIANNMQAVNVINTPQGQVILSPPSNQTQSSQALPTLTVPSYPQTITTNSPLTSSTSTSTANQNAAVLQNVLAQQQLIQNLTGTQNIGGIQLSGQNQLNWLQQALNLQNPRTSGPQALQVQNHIQGLQNLQAFPAVQGLQGLQGIQAVTPQGQIISGNAVPNLSAVALGSGGAISAIPLNGQQAATGGSAMTGTQAVIAAAQIQQDPNDPTKWQIVTPTSQGASTGNMSTPLSSGSPATPLASDAPPSGRRLRRVACTCPNCTSTEKHTGENNKKLHICHIAGCGKVYGKTSHLRAHLRWHSGDRPFVCSWLFCGKRFTRSDELQRHKRTHTGEKKFQCPECNKRFMRSDHLSKHIKTHSTTKRDLGGDDVSSTQGLEIDSQMEADEDGMEDDEEEVMIDPDTKAFRVSLSEDEEDGSDMKLENLAS